jgi:hypothetical protein
MCSIGQHQLKLGFQYAPAASIAWVLSNTRPANRRVRAAEGCGRSCARPDAWGRDASHAGQDGVLAHFHGRAAR